MTTFDKREEGFESKFAHDEELRFKARARRNNPNGDSVFTTVRKDFDEKGVAQSDHQIRRTMEEAMEKATAEIQTGR